MRRPSADPPHRSWHAWAWQALVLLGVFGLVWLLAGQVQEALQARGIRSGFAFLFEPAGFSIGESPIDFDAVQPYWRAFLVGLLNTLRAAGVAMLLATLLGLLVGVGRLSGNFLVRAMSRMYVEVFRNIPLLLQLLTVYFLLAERLPPAVEALQPLPGVFLSKSGLSIPWGGEVPAHSAFSIEGGANLTPEFLAVFTALAIYAAAYIAEIVRAGIESVPRGHIDAADALGLTPRQRLRFIVLPLALRLMLPPATNQYLNIIKNSSLAVAVGYPDLVSVANTSLNQTGQAVECLTIMMAVYLVLSLATAAASAWYNTRQGRR